MVMVQNEEQRLMREEYNSFVSGIEFLGIRLYECSTKSADHRPIPAKTGIEIKFSTSLGEVKRGDKSVSFDTLAEVEAIFKNREDGVVLGNIKVSYILNYASKFDGKEEILQLFTEKNVPMNAWPYLREFIQNTLQRMGWASFILPPLRPKAAKQKRPSKATAKEKN